MPVSTAPFYASVAQPTVFTSVGGLRVDEWLRVLDTDGQPIRACSPWAPMPAPIPAVTTTCGNHVWCAEQGLVCHGRSSGSRVYRVGQKAE